MWLVSLSRFFVVASRRLLFVAVTRFVAVGRFPRADLSLVCNLGIEARVVVTVVCDDLGTAVRQH